MALAARYQGRHRLAPLPSLRPRGPREAQNRRHDPLPLEHLRDGLCRAFTSPSRLTYALTDPPHAVRSREAGDRRQGLCRRQELYAVAFLTPLGRLADYAYEQTSVRLLLAAITDLPLGETSAYLRSRRARRLRLRRVSSGCRSTSDFREGKRRGCE